MFLFYHAAFQQITPGPLFSIDGQVESAGGGMDEVGGSGLSYPGEGRGSGKVAGNGFWTH